VFASPLPFRFSNFCRNHEKNAEEQLLRRASAPPRSYGQRLEIALGTLPRGLIYNCVHKAGHMYYASLRIFRVVLLLQRRRRGAAGLGELQ
jgi:hypothetical protein